MLFSDFELREFELFQQRVRQYGGEAAVRRDYNMYRRKYTSKKKKDQIKGSLTLYNKNNAHWQKVKENKPTPTKIISLSSSLQYDSKRDNKRKEMEIDNSFVSFEFNKVTAKKKKGNTGGKHKAQLAAHHLANSPAPVITPQHGDFVEVEFSSKSSVFILYARKDSKCPLLQAIHNYCYEGGGKSLDEYLDTLPIQAWEKDHHAGGAYAAFGIGSMDKRQAGPFFLKNHGYEKAKQITSCLSSIFGRVAAALLNYIPHVYRENEKLKSLNENFSFPPIDRQGAVGWMANQVAIRRIGKGCKHNTKTEDGVVGLHADAGDLSTMHPLVYIPRGGSDGRGGIIADSRLVIAESSIGGKYIEIETNVRDTVCIVVFNSAESLHGLVQSCPEGETGDAWSTRLVPFITKHIYHFISKTKNNSAAPIDNYNVLKLK